MHLNQSSVIQYLDFCHAGGYQHGAAPGPYHPPPPGFAPGPGQQPSYMQSQTTVVVQPHPNVVVVGGCPACRVGDWRDTSIEFEQLFCIISAIIWCGLFLLMVPGWGFRGWLHLFGCLLRHIFLPSGYSVLSCHATAEMSKLWSNIRLKNTCHHFYHSPSLSLSFRSLVNTMSMIFNPLALIVFCVVISIHLFTVLFVWDNPLSFSPSCVENPLSVIPFVGWFAILMILWLVPIMSCLSVHSPQIGCS